ncbi:MAG: aldehyde dehydrogenase family protein [Pseudomonadota bacterium]
MIGAWKLGPTLAAGNSVVLKPSETVSLSLIRMAQLALGGNRILAETGA